VSGQPVHTKIVTKVEEWLFDTGVGPFLRLSIARIPSNPERIYLVRARLTEREIPRL
jgi:hypothetical protein